MPKLTITQRGSFDNITRYMQNVKLTDVGAIFNKYGPVGVTALENATPIDSGLTANSWYYEILETRGTISLRWCNRHMVEGVPVVILLEYGHGTRNGGLVQGHDFIMPAIRPIFDQISADIEREVS
jgi:hypothetical protein